MSNYLQYDDYHTSHVEAKNRGWKLSQLQAIGAELHHMTRVAKSSANPPDRQIKEPRPAYLQALGALLITLLDDARFLELLSGGGVAEKGQRWCFQCKSGLFPAAIAGSTTEIMLNNEELRDARE